MVTHLCRHSIGLVLKVVDLGDSKFDIIQGFSQPVLTLLLPFKDSVNLGFDLIGFFYQLAQKDILVFAFELSLILDEFHLLLQLLIPLIALIEVLVGPPQSLLVLIHAQSQAVLELCFFSENSAVVDLLNGFPFLAQLLLDVSDHVVAVPFATVLHILDQSVANFTNFHTSKDL